MLMVLFILMWAVLGKVDIIVSASGKIIPSERAKTIAAVDRGSGTLQVARSRALLASLAAGHPVVHGDTDGIAAEKIEQARAQLESQWHNIASRLQDLDGEIARYAMQVPIARQREQNYRLLANTGILGQLPAVP